MLLDPQGQVRRALRALMALGNVCNSCRSPLLVVLTQE